jgi:DNA polymerase III alpha subunit
LLSYYTAYLRCYYPSEWLAACIQVDRLDEDKLAVLLRECAQDRIVVKEPNVNESGVATSVNKKGEILLPLSTIKGVGTRAVEIIEHQPYTDIKDFCYRARPNRGMVAALAEKEALSCLTDIDQFEYYEDFMEHWDQLVAERTRDEKNAIKLNKLRDKNSLSFNDIMNNTKRTVVDEKAEDISSLLNDELFD